MNALVFGNLRAPALAPVLRAHAGAVWIWPGIALTEKLGTAIVRVGAEVARFWITRLHGPEANDSLVLKCVEAAAQKLNEGDEASAQRALNASGLTKLSPDGAALARAVVGSLGIVPLDMPFADGPRLWRTDDIAANLLLFKDHAPAATSLARGRRHLFPLCRPDVVFPL